MTRDEIIKALQQYFTVKELVCDHTYQKWGERSWQFLDTAYLHALLVIRRDILQKPMSCNYNGMTQRGLRCNRCELVRTKPTAYLSAHILGKAGDFTVKDMTAEQARQTIKAKQSLLPCNVRLEAGVSWLHFDVLPQAGIEKRVYEFKV